MLLRVSGRFGSRLSKGIPGSRFLEAYHYSMVFRVHSHKI